MNNFGTISSEGISLKMRMVVVKTEERFYNSERRVVFKKNSLTTSGYFRWPSSFSSILINDHWMVSIGFQNDLLSILQRFSQYFLCCQLILQRCIGKFLLILQRKDRSDLFKHIRRILWRYYTTSNSFYPYDVFFNYLLNVQYSTLHLTIQQIISLTWM